MLLFVAFELVTKGLFDQFLSRKYPARMGCENIEDFELGRGEY